MSTSQFTGNDPVACLGPVECVHRPVILEALQIIPIKGFVERRNDVQHKPIRLLHPFQQQVGEQKRPIRLVANITSCPLDRTLGPPWMKAPTDSTRPSIVGKRFTASSAAALTESMSEKSMTSAAMSVAACSTPGLTFAPT